MTNHTASETVLRRHPIRGALSGILLGSGAALHLLSFAIVPFGAWPLLAAPVAVAAVVGLTWGLFGPARAPKGRMALERRQTISAAERATPAEIHAAQLLAARKANAELHGLAAADDDAMIAALHEAEKDVLPIVAPRIKRGLAQSKRVATNPPARAVIADLRSTPTAAVPPAMAVASESPVANPAVSLVDAAPVIDTSASVAQPDLVMAPAPADSLSLVLAAAPASPPLSLGSPTEASSPVSAEVPDVASEPELIRAAATLPVDIAPASPVEPTSVPASPPLSLPTDIAAFPRADVAPASALSPADPASSSPTGAATHAHQEAPAIATPADAVASPELVTPELATPELTTPASAPPAQPTIPQSLVLSTSDGTESLAAEPATAAVHTPPITAAQDMAPFASSPLPSDADEALAAAAKLEAQLEAALREAMAVTLGTN